MTQLLSVYCPAESWGIEELPPGWGGEGGHTVPVLDPFLLSDPFAQQHFRQSGLHRMPH